MIDTEENNDQAENSNTQVHIDDANYDPDNAIQLRRIIADLKKIHLNEINELRNQLDEVRTRATIIETTKQDELDEIKFRHKQEMDSLNHIINALQSDLNTVRHEYELMSNNFKEFKRQVHYANSNEIKSPVSSNSFTNRLNLSPFGSSSASKALHHNINQENENLEEDMRKAKESAEMLRSVVLPLETEITNLRSRSNTSDKKIKELEKIIDQKDKEKQKILDEEQKLIDESYNKSVENEFENFNSDKSSVVDNIYFKKYIQLKKYLKKNENKFIDLEQKNLKTIKQIFNLLTHEQKLLLLLTRPKSKSILSSKSENSSKKIDNLETTENDQNQTEDSINIEQSETISKIEELLDFLTSNQNNNINNKASDDSQSINKSIDTASSNDLSISYDLLNSKTNLNPSDQNQVYSYAELLALYENEKSYRTNYLESSFNEKSIETSKQIEELNKEISNFAYIIHDLRNEYTNLQLQCKSQIDQSIKINEKLNNDIKIVDQQNEELKQENLRLKAENKQFYGDKSILIKEIDEQYQQCSSVEEAQRQISILKQELVKLILANQALNKQHSLSLGTIKHLRKVNTQYQSSNNLQEHVAIAQSLESELERERKVKLEIESELNEYKNQLILIKERGQSLVESLKQRNEQNEFEIKKLKEENQELQNQIQSLKKDAKNSLSVQEDLVRLIQSLQIELNQTKTSTNDGQIRQGAVEVRCQHEDDFNECSECKSQFSVTRRKHRCKHCCKIFCADCCSKTVLSGPNLRPHKVCASCHTLLDKDSPPNLSNPA